MSKAIFELNAELRSSEAVGKGASRRLRREKKVPAIIYGGKDNPVNITLPANVVFKALEHEAFYSHILTLTVDGKKQKTILRDIQRHPSKQQILHMDFQRVSASDVITMKVPLHFINEDACPGVKAGGVINHNIVDLHIKCKANQIPEFIEVDLGSLELDKTIHLSQLTLPSGVEIPELALGEEHDITVVSVHTPRVAEEEETEAEATETTDETKAEESDNEAEESETK